MMPRRRHPHTPAPEGTWARAFESVFCHETDCFPGALLFFPFAVGLIFGCVFSAPNSSLTAAPGVKPALAALGFSLAAGVLLYWALGLPFFRAQGGCLGGCRALLASLRPTVAATGAARSVQEHPLAAVGASVGP
jgi:hypothetical protein